MTYVSWRLEMTHFGFLRRCDIEAFRLNIFIGKSHIAQLRKSDFNIYRGGYD